ncbi:hypothetical protein Tco_0664335, partial [Tanacetum coccineum]
RNDASIRSPTGIGAGLGEHLAAMERSNKIPIEDRSRFGAWFANRVWGWRVAAPLQTRPIAIPTFGYGVLLFNLLWSLVSAGTDTPYLLDGYVILVFRIVIFKISSFKLQNARVLLCFTNYSIITAILKYKRLSNNSLQ